MKKSTATKKRTKPPVKKVSHAKSRVVAHKTKAHPKKKKSLSDIDILVATLALLVATGISIMVLPLFHL